MSGKPPTLALPIYTPDDAPRTLDTSHMILHALT